MLFFTCCVPRKFCWSRQQAAIFLRLCLYLLSKQPVSSQTELIYTFHIGLWDFHSSFLSKERQRLDIWEEEKAYGI